MVTTDGKTTQAPGTTHVADMPPLKVVTTGVPSQELLKGQAKHVRDEHRTRVVALVIAIVAGLIVVAGSLFVAAQWPQPTNDHMGLGPVAWSDYRAGERAVVPLTPVANAPDWASYRR